MKKNKIFGIGAVVILILVGVAPAFSGSIIKKEENGLLNIITNLNEYDLTVEIIGDPYAKDTHPIVDKDGNEYALYTIDYSIYNNMDTKFTGNPLTAIYPEENTNYEIDSWYEIELDSQGNVIPIQINGKQHLYRTHDIEVRCISQDEKYFYDKNVYLECGVAGGQEATPGDNVDFKKAWKFWSEKTPTKGQLIGFGEFSKIKNIDTNLGGDTYNLPIPKFMENSHYFSGGFNRLKSKISNELNTYENTPHFNKSQLGLGDYNHIYEAFEVTDGYDILGESEGSGIVEEIWSLLEDFTDYIYETLPKAWKNHRFGWLNEMTLYRSRVLIDLIAFGMFCAKFYQDGKEQFNNIGGWFLDLADIIVITLTTLTFPALKFSTLIARIPAVIVDMLDLIDIFFTNGYSLILYAIIEKLCLDMEKLKLYRGTKPWEQTIKLNITVGQFADNEEVWVYCRGESWKMDYNNQEKTIELPAEWMSGDFPLNPNDDEDGYQGGHSCVITVDGSEHRPITTRKFASYCYSGGDVDRIVLLDDEEPPGPGKSKIIDKPDYTQRPILDILRKKIIQRFPLLHQLINFQWLTKTPMTYLQASQSFFSLH